MRGVIWDISRRKQAEEALRAERDRSARIINGAPAIICGIAPDGATTFINPAGESVTGYQSDELVGRNWWRTFYPGDELTFRTRVVEWDEERCATHPGSALGVYLLVSVSDTGRGVPKGIQVRVFDPFFTTKDVGQGTGMGLAMAYGIVKNHGGSIWLRSEEGQGATFGVYLPLAPETANGGWEAPPSDAPVPGTGVILLVDDESIVRGVASVMLEKLGYDVLVANNGREALDVYCRCRDEIDLVILDIIMPEMGGRECFEALRQINPHLRVVLSTGYGRDRRTRQMLDDGAVGFVQKPYRLSDLSAAVSRALKA